MGRLIKTNLACVLGLLCLVVAGCAVLTVDVDVYKGPLANTPEIQGEQVISLVMGAKPLLVQLRDHLEEEGPPYPILTKGSHGAITPGMALQDRLRHFRARPGYEAGYMSTNEYRFGNEFALRVNDILGLYEDLNQQLPEDVEKSRQWADDYERARDIVHPSDPTKGRRVWEQIEKHMTLVPTNGVTPDDLNNLKAAYEVFFVATNTEFQTNIFAVFTNDFAEFAAKGEKANKEFHALENGRAERDAALLFSTNLTEKHIFIAYVMRVSKAFFDSRADLRSLLRFALEEIPKVHDSPLQSAEKRHEIQTSIATAAGRLTRIQFLAQVLTNDTARLDVDWSQLRTAYSNSLALTPGATNLEALAQGTGVWTAAERALAGILALDDGHLSQALLRIDGALALRAELEAMPEYEFGLGRGPLLKISQLEVSAAIAEMMRGLESLSGGILNRGRPALGIETLIERYLSAKQDVAEAFNKNDQFQFQQLLDALVEFGEKVTTLGNSATLIEGGNNPEVQDYVTVLQSVGNSIIVYVDELKEQRLHNHDLKTRAGMVRDALSIITTKGFDGSYTNKMNAKDAAEQLVTVLRSEYIKALLEGSGLDSATNVSTGVFTASGAGNSVTGAVTSVVAIGKASATNNAAAGLVAAAGGSNTTATATITITNSVTAPGSADKYLQAVESAIELRSGMIYLRPASSYLRSSYPASTLQRNRAQAWRNMLLEHGMRQIPLFGGILSGDINEKSPTIAQIDQQSWQSINHVRVAGAGNANYVIAKDDIGNWYVKSFSAIPTNIINSMKNLALFSAGNAFGGPLPIRSSNGAVVQDTNSVLGIQLSQATLKYHDNSTNTFYSLTESVATLSTDVTNSWGSLGTNDPSVVSNLNSNAFLKVLSTVTSATNSVAKALDAATATAACDRGILDILRAVRRYYTALSLGISQSTIDATTQLNIKKTSSYVIREFLDEFSNRREQDLGRYESALDVINSATSAK